MPRLWYTATCNDIHPRHGSNAETFGDDKHIEVGQIIMQTLIQVACKKGSSLRDGIVNDRRLDGYSLVVSEKKRPTRPRGWAEIHGTSDDGYGAINIESLASSSILLCRVVTRGSNPGPISGDFLRYLLSCHRRRIQAIHIVPA
jgi:hypothetical protein